MENNIFIKIQNKNTIQKMRLMRWSWPRIKKWSRKIFILYAIAILMTIVLLVRVENKLIAILPLFIAFALNQAQQYDIKQRFSYYDNQRQLEFLYWFELLVPHLAHATNSRSGLYQVLTKLEARLKPDGVDGSDGILKHGVNRLILDISNNPGDIQAFKDFAFQCSGSELAEDVSIALFDWQQNTDDIQAIARLKKKVHKAKEKQIERIVGAKISKFDWYSQRQLMAVVVLVFGILGTSIVFQMLDMFKLMQ